jgi:hypothetical protein
MNSERCSNPDCKRPYGIYQIGGQMPGTKELEDIVCPYCGHITQQMCNGSWQTFALTDEQEAKYNTEYPINKY